MKINRMRTLLAGIGLIATMYLILLIPYSEDAAPENADRTAFAWRQDEYWSDLEALYNEARACGCTDLAPALDSGFAMMDSLITEIRNTPQSPESPVFRKVEHEFFTLGALVAQCPSRLADYANEFFALRSSLKEQSIQWDMNSKSTRDCMYRIIYGGRTAVEEVMLQAPPDLIPERIVSQNVMPSSTPSATVNGLQLCSGDILVSRGGAPTSALIARGNDYPGNFSHTALVHVDESTSLVSIIEAHIECGVVVSSPDRYFRDTKLRIMVLRLRTDVPGTTVDPATPHEAAKSALQQAMSGHVAYDFEMNASDHSKLFCSEVVSEAYSAVGINLWKGMSHISSSGTRMWLSAFGVENFTTQEPSDLEYDPQLRVVAEWRDKETLVRDRVDNAVVDVMLEAADEGDLLEYDAYMLPVARIAKAYSIILNRFGVVGPVPEGMGAIAALKNQWFSRRQKAVADSVSALIQNFRVKNSYFPPYWELVKLSRQAYGK